jgi:hypothetical protein
VRGDRSKEEVKGCKSRMGLMQKRRQFNPIRVHASPRPSHPKKKTHKNDNPKPSSRQQQIDPTLNLGVLDVKPGGDDARFVQSAVELDDDFAGAVVVDDFEFTYVAWRRGGLVGVL